MITADNGQSTVNGLTFHVLRRRLLPRTSTRSVPAAPTRSSRTRSTRRWPAAATTSWSSTRDPRSGQPAEQPARRLLREPDRHDPPVKLQGVGPGGFQGSTFVPGSIIDGSAFGGDTALAGGLVRQRSPGLTWDGNQNVNDGEVDLRPGRDDGVFGRRSFNGQHRRLRPPWRRPSRASPATSTTSRADRPACPPTIVTQGGAIFANAYARYLQITNNVGPEQRRRLRHDPDRHARPAAIDPPTPQAPRPTTRTTTSGSPTTGSSPTPAPTWPVAIGIFAGADNYEVADNDICGNFSLEYGGGLSVYGRSPNGSIHHNRIYLNHVERRGRRHHDRRRAAGDGR